MRCLFKMGAVALIMLFYIKPSFASLDSPPIKFKLEPGAYLSLPLDFLYPEYYNITCNVNDITSTADDFNAIRVWSAYRPHEMKLNDSSIGWKSQVSLKTKMSGSNFTINKVMQGDDRITIENLDFSDVLSFTCIAHLAADNTAETPAAPSG